MDMFAIEQTWDSLAGRRVIFVERFYSRLFESYPEYRKLFPESMNPQKEKMVEMISSIARFADHIDLIRVYLLNIGAAHRHIGISGEHIENFKEVFLDSLAETCGESWGPKHETAWRAVFDDVIIPIFEEGLSTDGQTPKPKKNSVP
jgi:hemoglobin-like flavoprotein